MRRTALLLALLLPLLPLAAEAQRPIPLPQLSAYLEGLERARGSFTQLNADGSISTGTIFLHRPGRIRFEYDPPEPALVMAGGGTVAVFDLKTRSAPEQFPLSRTPLSLILAREVNLSSSMVVSHSSDGLATTLVVQDPESPEMGHIRLVFTDNPVELRQWVIRDGGGQETTVILGDLERGVRLAPILFDIGHEAERITGRDAAP